MHQQSLNYYSLKLMTPLPQLKDLLPWCLSRTYCSALLGGNLWPLWRGNPLKQGVPRKVKTEVHWGKNLPLQGKVNCRGQSFFAPIPASTDHVGCSEPLAHGTASLLSPTGMALAPWEREAMQPSIHSQCSWENLQNVTMHFQKNLLI